MSTTTGLMSTTTGAAGESGQPVSAKTVADLREKTGAGLLDCKKALTEANGNIEEAITILRKKGAASAAKKADRTTKEGLIESYIHVGGKVGVNVALDQTFL